MDLGYFETALPVKDIVRSMAFYEALGFARANYAAQALAAVARRECLRFYREPSGDEQGAGFMLTDPDGRPVFFINMKKYSAADFIGATGEMLA